MRPDPPRPMDAMEQPMDVMERPMDVMKPVRPVRPPQAGATIERPPALKTAGARKDRPMVPNKRPRPKIRAGRGDDD